jgi:peptide/nickel transport system permease protein
VTAAYLTKRLLLVVYTLLIVSLLVFAITQLLPADAAVTLLGQSATPEALDALRVRLGLDQPAWLQFGHWLMADAQWPARARLVA